MLTTDSVVKATASAGISTVMVQTAEIADRAVAVGVAVAVDPGKMVAAGPAAERVPAAIRRMAMGTLMAGIRVVLTATGRMADVAVAAATCNAADGTRCRDAGPEPAG
jgi:hypothetical protein